jgi:uncharacterized membrane protein
VKATRPTAVKHGEGDKTVEITIDKGKDFKEGITFKATVDPDKSPGLKVKVDPQSWKPSDPTTVKVMISTDEKTPAGDYTVRVTGKPDKGEETYVDLKVHVPEKK